jgi:hypothetical protein
VMLSSICFNCSQKLRFGILLKKQTARCGLCFLPVERTETTVVSRTYGHSCQANPCGFSIGCIGRRCQLFY